jgi:FtsP/CotA-like multicopper oxidase with cupredoxin domain
MTQQLAAVPAGRVSTMSTVDTLASTVDTVVAGTSATDVAGATESMMDTLAEGDEDDEDRGSDGSEHDFDHDGDRDADPDPDVGGVEVGIEALDPNAFPDYFSPTIPNFANSPLPTVVGGVVVPGTGIRKFFNTLAGLGPANQNDLNNFIPVATPDTITYSGCDYYEIGVRQFTQQMHEDLPPTTLRGYIQLNNGTDSQGHNTIVPPSRPWYLGPLIKTTRGKPVRVKFINQLPVGDLGRLFLPVDTTVLGAGVGPSGPEMYTQNRAVLHLHGGDTQWISDGTPYQWITPATQVTSYPAGTSLRNVPDMPNPGPGASTYYYPNGVSARLMWYHDHSYAITRLNVYAGMVAGFLVNDQVEGQLIHDDVIPADEVLLVIQDKTFVPSDTQLEAEDPTWNKPLWGGLGNFWFPHVYMPNQNPFNESGANPMGRWDYGPWFWPPYTNLKHGPVPNPYYNPVTAPWEPPLAPGTPRPSEVPEAFMDTPVINGTAYPSVTLEPKAYRFRILNGCNDRTVNLQLYYAVSNAAMWNPDGTLNDADAGEVPMVPACPNPAFPPNWPTDGRAGGVPDPTAVGPDWYQIGNECGFLPQVAVLPNQPVNYIYNRRDITVLNVSTHTLLLGPAERADVVLDFSSVPPGTNLILYTDAPAPMPGFDPRYDYYTNDPDQTTTGGAPTTQPGYGPNTRTIMQIRIEGAPAAPFDLATLQARLPAAYAASQNPPIVPEAAYNDAYGAAFTNTYVPIQNTQITFTPFTGGAPVTFPLGPKAIQELFEVDYGRMNSTFGVELPNTSALIQTTIPMGYIDPPTEILLPSNLATPVGSANDGTQLWKITHNGVDTHSVHFHYFNVQLINRVGWDGAISPPDPNEVGWKETVRMNPLQDTIVAMRPALPSLPFKIGDSVRLYSPVQAPNITNDFIQVNPQTGQPAVVTNQVYNFGWEFAWHCHLLGHEENDMMRAIVFQASPAAPTSLSQVAFAEPPRVTLAWLNHATNPPATNMLIQRATNSAFTTGVTTFSVGGTVTNYADTTATPGVTYYYRVRAENSVAYSDWTNVVSSTVPVAAPTSLTTAVSTSPPLSVGLAWINHVTGTTIDIQRATNTTFTANLRTWNIAFTSNFADTTAAAGTTYYYRVRTKVGSASSAWSNTASAVTPVTPAVPTDLAVTATAPPTGTATATLTWTESAGSVVGGFTIQRATNSSFTAGLTSFNVGGTARTFVNTGLARNTRYFYRIQAFNGAGTSAFSASVNVLTPA